MNPPTELPIRLPLELTGAAADAPYPVANWHPPHRGHSNMRIDTDGRWWHEGRPIAKATLARLFARLLRREPDGRHVLVTPVEMLDIDVEDAPLIASEVESEGEGEARTVRLRIALLDDWIEAGPDHAISIENGPRGPLPYLGLANGLRARIDRPAFYALAELAIEESASPPGLWSGGLFFPLGDDA